MKTLTTITLITTLVSSFIIRDSKNIFYPYKKNSLGGFELIMKIEQQKKCKRAIGNLQRDCPELLLLLGKEISDDNQKMIRNLYSEIDKNINTLKVQFEKVVMDGSPHTSDREYGERINKFLTDIGDFIESDFSDMELLSFINSIRYERDLDFSLEYLNKLVESARIAEEEEMKRLIKGYTLFEWLFGTKE